MEKRRPTFNLDTIKVEFVAQGFARLKGSARRSAAALGLHGEVLQIVLSIQSSHFYKSMTTYADHTQWQDVYHVPWKDLVLYVKFSHDDGGHVVVSLKEK